MIKLGTLNGEEMLRFRSGQDMYPYCERCVHSAITPVTQILGCEIGDDAQVRDYSTKVAAEEIEDTEAERCPGFTSEDQAKVYAEKQQAAFVKEVPAEGDPQAIFCPHCDERKDRCICRTADVKELKDELEDLRLETTDPETQKLIDEVATNVNEMLEERHVSRVPSLGDYSFRDEQVPQHQENPGYGEVVASLVLGTKREVSQPEMGDEFYNDLRTRGADLSEPELHHLIIEMIHERGYELGLIDDDTLERITQEMQDPAVYERDEVAGEGLEPNV
jgi:hypothetical protein